MEEDKKKMSVLDKMFNIKKAIGIEDPSIERLEALKRMEEYMSASTIRASQVEHEDHVGKSYIDSIRSTIADELTRRIDSAMLGGLTSTAGSAAVDHRSVIGTSLSSVIEKRSVRTVDATEDDLWDHYLKRTPLSDEFDRVNTSDRLIRGFPCWNGFNPVGYRQFLLDKSKTIILVRT